MFKKITFFLFNKNNVSIIKKNKKNKIYIYNKNFYFLFILDNNTKYFLEKYAKYLIIFFLKNNLTAPILNAYLNKLFYSWNNYFFKKIKFSGKGYKIKKSKKKNIKLHFNRAHFTIFIFKKELLKKIRKTKCLIKGTNYNSLNNHINKIIYVRKLNLYTSKGLRLSRGIIFKKASKKGVSL